MNYSRMTLFFLCAMFFVAAQPTSAITIPTVVVGDPGNAADPSNGDPRIGVIKHYGSVPYAYRIGTTEVTNAQYVEFLNEKAKSDPLGLFNVRMGTDALGGITQSGMSGSFTYATRPNMANKPVNYVSWYDSIRFANWLNNGQGNGSTETGAYKILGNSATPSNELSITRSPNAMWFLPSENEWYKSAYYQPASQGGDLDNYWLYATASNSAPTVATANIVGDISNPGDNVANYLSGVNWNSQVGNVTTVGSAGPLSESFYGTADQMGNVWEWNESLEGLLRTLRGGGFYNDSFYLRSSFRNFLVPTVENFNIGFRVATVPEPSTFALAVLGALGLLIAARRRR